MIVAKVRVSEKLNRLDQYIHALVKRFYLRASVNGSAQDLGASEWFACNILGRKGRATMTELSKECGLALSSMTGVVDRMLIKGLVRRVRDETEDRRKVYVELDKKGEKLYQSMLENEMEMIITMMDSLEPGEQDALLLALGKAVGSLGR